MANSTTTYTGAGTATVTSAGSAAAGVMKDHSPKYSLVDVTLKDGTKVEVTISAGIGVTEFLSRSMAETGMLVLRNGTQATAIAASEVAMFTITQLTLEV